MESLLQTVKTITGVGEGKSIRRFDTEEKMRRRRYKGKEFRLAKICTTIRTD